MIRRLIGIAALAATVALPVVAYAQGVPGGIERGSRDGERAAGPVGAAQSTPECRIDREWPTGSARFDGNMALHGEEGRTAAARRRAKTPPRPPLRD